MSGTINVNIYAILVKHGYKAPKGVNVKEFRIDLHEFVRVMDVTEESRRIVKQVLGFYNDVQYKKLMYRLQNKGHVK